MVPGMGLEPIWIAPFDFKSNAYTNSAIRATTIIITQNYRVWQQSAIMVTDHGGNYRSKTPSGDHFFQKIRSYGKIKTQGTLAEWLRSGLQNRVHQFNSGRCLHSS